MTYNLTEKYGEQVKDKTPDWIEQFIKDNKDGVKKDIRDLQPLKDIKSIYDL